MRNNISKVPKFPVYAFVITDNCVTTILCNGCHTSNLVAKYCIADCDIVVLIVIDIILLIVSDIVLIVSDIVVLCPFTAQSVTDCK